MHSIATMFCIVYVLYNSFDNCVKQIKVGLMTCKNGKIKKQFGTESSVVIVIKSSSNADEIVSAAVMKFHACSWNFLTSTKYILLYPDGRPAVNIPGQTTPFKLDTYKHFLEKQYRDIRLFICKEEDFNAGINYEIFMYCCVQASPDFISIVIRHHSHYF